MNKKYLAVIIIAFLAGLFFLVARPIAARLTSGIVTEETSADETLVSDEGDDEYFDWNAQEVIEPSERPAYWAFAELALEYDQKIPFQDGGRYGRTGYPVIDSGVDNRYLPEGTMMGMDSLGYIMWMYRNVFGSYDKRLENPSLMYEEAAVGLEELQIGDVGMLSLEVSGNHYGVCIGHIDGLAVFSHCSSEPHLLYPGGVNRLTYLAEQTDRYMNGLAPADFKYFVRPTAEWESGVYE